MAGLWEPVCDITGSEAIAPLHRAEGSCDQSAMDQNRQVHRSLLYRLGRIGRRERFKASFT